MLIGDIARLSDLSPATIRYYEEIGLLTAPPRSESGYRHYSKANVDELAFIRKGQGLGFSLDELAEILKISRAGEAPCSQVLEVAERNLAATEERIRHLQALRHRLARQIETWKGRPVPGCSSGGGTLCEIINSAELPARPRVP